MYLLRRFVAKGNYAKVCYLVVFRCLGDLNN